VKIASELSEINRVPRMASLEFNTLGVLTQNLDEFQHKSIRSPPIVTDSEPFKFVRISAL
jgi:hypothetical protein